MTIYTLPYGIVVEVAGGGGNISSRLFKDKHLTRKEADIVEFLLLAHACAGVNIASIEYIEGLDTLINTLANQ